MDLTEWFVNFMKYKDSMKKEIINIETKENVVFVKYKDRDEKYLVVDKLKDINIKGLKEFNGLVTSNRKKNLDFLIDKWDNFVINNFVIHFINPNSNTDKRWSIFPKIHDFIVDRKNLRKSLEVLFSNVEPV